MRRCRTAAVVIVGLIAFWPANADAAFLATCPDSGTGDRVFGIDGSFSGSVSCFDFGPGNNLTGGASDDFLNGNPDLTFFDYDGSPNSNDNFYFFTEDGLTTIDSVEYAFGTFNFGSAYTSTNTKLYLGLKVGNNLDPAWAVFEFTGFDIGDPLSGNWYITPVQGAGISHSSIYGDGEVPPGVTQTPLFLSPLRSCSWVPAWRRLVRHLAGGPA